MLASREVQVLLLIPVGVVDEVFEDRDGVEVRAFVSHHLPSVFAVETHCLDPVEPSVSEVYFVFCSQMHRCESVSVMMMMVVMVM